MAGKSKRIISNGPSESARAWKGFGTGVATGVSGVATGVALVTQGVGTVIGGAYKMSGLNIGVRVVAAGLQSGVKGVYRRAQAVAATISEVDKALHTYRNIRTDQKDGYEVPGLRSYLHRENASSESLGENSEPPGNPRHEYGYQPPDPPRGKTIVQEVDPGQNNGGYSRNPINENSYGQPDSPRQGIIVPENVRRSPSGYTERLNNNNPKSVFRRDLEIDQDASASKPGPYGTKRYSRSSDSQSDIGDNDNVVSRSSKTSPSTDMTTPDNDHGIRDFTFSPDENKNWPDSCDPEQRKMWENKKYKVVPNPPGLDSGLTFSAGGHNNTHHDSGKTITVLDTDPKSLQLTLRDVLNVVNIRNNNEGVNLDKIKGPPEFLKECIKAAGAANIPLKYTKGENNSEIEDIYRSAYKAAHPPSPPSPGHAPFRPLKTTPAPNPESIYRAVQHASNSSQHGPSPIQKVKGGRSD